MGDWVGRENNFDIFYTRISWPWLLENYRENFPAVVSWSIGKYPRPRGILWVSNVKFSNILRPRTTGRTSCSKWGEVDRCRQEVRSGYQECRRNMRAVQRGGPLQQLGRSTNRTQIGFQGGRVQCGTGPTCHCTPHTRQLSQHTLGSTCSLLLCNHVLYPTFSYFSFWKEHAFEGPD